MEKEKEQKPKKLERPDRIKELLDKIDIDADLDEAELMMNEKYGEMEG